MAPQCGNPGRLHAGHATTHHHDLLRRLGGHHIIRIAHTGRRRIHRAAPVTIPKQGQIPNTLADISGSTLKVLLGRFRIRDQLPPYVNQICVSCFQVFLRHFHFQDSSHTDHRNLRSLLDGGGEAHVMPSGNIEGGYVVRIVQLRTHGDVETVHTRLFHNRYGVLDRILQGHSIGTVKLIHTDPDEDRIILPQDCFKEIQPGKGRRRRAPGGTPSPDLRTNRHPMFMNGFRQPLIAGDVAVFMKCKRVREHHGWHAHHLFKDVGQGIDRPAQREAGASFRSKHEPLDRIVIGLAFRSVGIAQKRGKANPVLDFHVLDLNRFENLPAHHLTPCYSSGIG